MAAAPENGAARAGEKQSSPARRLIAGVRGPGFVMSSRRLWLLSIKLHRDGHTSLAKAVKNINSMLFHNSLPQQVQVSPDIRLGHQGFGTILHANVEIGRGVKIFHNVTIFVRPPNGSNRVIIEDGAAVGANAVILTPWGEDLRIGENARVGAGAVVTHDVPANMIAVSPRVELRPRASARGRAGAPVVDDDGLGDD
jgi:serine O-acetyltransferase